MVQSYCRWTTSPTKTNKKCSSTAIHVILTMSTRSEGWLGPSTVGHGFNWKFWNIFACHFFGLGSLVRFASKFQLWKCQSHCAGGGWLNGLELGRWKCPNASFVQSTLEGTLNLKKNHRRASTQLAWCRVASSWIFFPLSIVFVQHPKKAVTTRTHQELVWFHQQFERERFANLRTGWL